MKILFRLGIVCALFVASFSAMAQDERLQIVATYSILGDVVSNVAGDVADVTTTMPAGADPHSFEPVPSDITALADADVVFINGGFFEEGLLEAIENADTDMNIVTASSCIPAIGFEDEHGHSDEDHSDEEHSDEHGDEDHDEEHSDDHGDEDHDDHSDEDHDEEHSDEDHDEEHSDEDHDDHDHEDHAEGENIALAELCEQHSAELAVDMMMGDTLGAFYSAECEAHSHDEHGEEDHDEEEHSEEGDHDHDHGACDPHVWMDVDNISFWVLMVRDTLADLDPANADTYTSNAADYLAALASLEDELQSMVDGIPAENRILVTSHDSMGYFAARYDFEIVTTIIASGSTLAEPSSADIADVIDTVNEFGVPAIFAETTVNDAIAEAIASETGAELFTLYSGSLSDADGPASTYLDYMRYNVTTIANALGDM
ncbi:MAG: metal ABC transporter substrate-binding protein [Chloroflexota bacterium]